jgi:hypothetical protein
VKLGCAPKRELRDKAAELRLVRADRERTAAAVRAAFLGSPKQGDIFRRTRSNRTAILRVDSSGPDSAPFREFVREPAGSLVRKDERSVRALAKIRREQREVSRDGTREFVGRVESVARREEESR